MRSLCVVTEVNMVVAPSFFALVSDQEGLIPSWVVARLGSLCFQAYLVLLSRLEDSHF